MLHVVGGVYEEHCDEPHWKQLFGSGGRAAAAVTKLLSGKVALHTYSPSSAIGGVEALASVFRFRVKCSTARVRPIFRYVHGLSIPNISPHPSAIRHELPIHLDAPNILRFGMLEGDAVVRGDRVVYDPQSPIQPRPFHENGSSARRLAIVVNRAEGKVLTGQTDGVAIAQTLIRKHRAAVAVVKEGPHGAVVCEGKLISRIPAYKTPSVFPIGSGDVFSAVFASQWAEKRKSAHSSAFAASIAVSNYCNTKALPISPTSLKKPKFPAINLARTRRKRPLVYLAGPFFDLAQRWLIHESRAALSSVGLRVFSPFHDVGRGSAEDVAPADIAALRKCDGVFAIMDGLDSGTLFEVGFARALGVPVVVLCEREGEEQLKMLVGSGCVMRTDFVSAIYEISWQCLK